MSGVAHIVDWEMSMPELFERPPDLVVECPEWLAEWMEWQEELDAYLMLPSLPPGPKGVYLGRQGTNRGRLVSAIMQDLFQARGWKTDTPGMIAAGMEMGVSTSVVKRLLTYQHPTVRLYSRVAAQVVMAADRYPRLLLEVRKMIDRGREER